MALVGGGRYKIAKAERNPTHLKCPGNEPVNSKCTIIDTTKSYSRKGDYLEGGTEQSMRRFSVAQRI